MLLKGQNILITGGAGFIGSNLAHECSTLGANITVFDTLKKELNANLANLEEVRDTINIVEGDTRNFDDIKEVVKDKDIIFNCAGHTSHSNSMKFPWLDLEINCRGNLNFLESVRKFNDAARIIFLGSSTQIGKMVFPIIDENHPECPLDIYSANKMVAEKYHLIYNKVYGLKITSIRCANIYGPRAAIHSNDYGFINYFIGLALKNKNITIYGNGEQKRMVLYIKDLTDAIIRASMKNKSIGEVIFAVGEDSYNINEIANAVVRIIGGKISHIDWPEERKKIEIGDVKISNKKIKKLLGLRPKYNLENGLLETKEYYLTRLSKYLRK